MDALYKLIVDDEVVIRPRRSSDHALHQGDITTLDLLIVKELRPAAQGLLGGGQQQHTGGVDVKAMNSGDLAAFPLAALLLKAQLRLERIGHTGGSLLGGLGGESGGFVDDDDAVAVEDDGKSLAAFNAFVDGDLDPSSGLEPARLHADADAVDEDAALGDEHSCSTPRHPRNSSGHRLVEAGVGDVGSESMTGQLASSLGNGA